MIRRIIRVSKRILGIKSTGRARCYNDVAPIPGYEGGSWIDTEVTPDQLRIEGVLDTLNLNGARMLHVGIGSSNIAKKYHDQTVTIDGITVITEEKNYADRLNLSNYQTYLINKFNEHQLNSLHDRYDYIIDNNLSSFACCRHHYGAMIKNYIQALNKNGMIITDTLGMSFFEDYAFPIDYSHLESLQDEYPVTAIKLTDSVFAVQKTEN